MPGTHLSILADIGGTNTRVALADGVTLRSNSLRRYANADHASLAHVLRAYMKAENIPGTEGACVAAAGPVRDGQATLTNLNWSFDRDQLAQVTGASRVAVLNDLQAQGHAIGHLPEKALSPVLPGETAAPSVTRLVVGVGTGFNAAPIYQNGQLRDVPPSECGHVNMPVRTEADLRLAQFVETTHGFPSVEDVLSGRGLVHIHRWLATEAGAEPAPSSAAIMTALSQNDPLATEAARTFTRLLGTVTGNLALEYLPFGGVFLIGGMTLAMAPHLKRLGFAEAFHDKGRFAAFMGAFPVYIVHDDYAALIGCAQHLDQV